jgi:hypothetical protein
MIAAAELAIQRQLTAVFIAADVIQVTLMRSVWTSDGSGGSVKGPEAPVAPQPARLIPLSDGASAGPSKTRLNSDGEQVAPGYMLMGAWDFDVERWDQFTVNGRRYEVVFINENQQYEVKAEVAYLDGI